MQFPAVVLLGPRQCGKTTLAFQIAQSRSCVYLDLENPLDIAKVSDLEAFCEASADRLIIFDEIQCMPNLFTPLRGYIDKKKRLGKKAGLFLFLGSASLDLLKQTSESLAGKIAIQELCPLGALEIKSGQINDLWVRGGFPGSFLANGDSESYTWRLNFLRTYLERDIPQLGPRIPAEVLRRFWTMLAHNQCQIFNASKLSLSLGVSSVSVARYLDLLVDLLVVRRLQPWLVNNQKRIVKAPKTMIRDSGLCHALLGIRSYEDLLGQPVAGASWESFVIENIIQCLPVEATYGFYRTSGGAEIDLVLQLRSQDLWVIEIKKSLVPTLSKGFFSACDDLKPTKKFLIYPGLESFSISDGVVVMSLSELMNNLRCYSK